MKQFTDGYADNALKTYSIYHPVGGDLNTKCERGRYMYDHVADIVASSLDDAFLSSQNDYESWSDYGFRSTSVGDIIGVDGLYYMVGPHSFFEVPSTVVGYIDWGIVSDRSYRRYEDFEDEIYGRGDE